MLGMSSPRGLRPPAAGRGSVGGLVEAAGVEPAPHENTNGLMARDLSSQLAGNSLPCGQLVVLWSALESSGILPSLGDLLVAQQRWVSPYPSAASGPFLPRVPQARSRRSNPDRGSMPECHGDAPSHLWILSRQSRSERLLGWVLRHCSQSRMLSA